MTPIENEETYEHYINDGNTGTTREVYHVSKTQLTEQAKMIKQRLFRGTSPSKKRKDSKSQKRNSLAYLD